MANELIGSSGEKLIPVDLTERWGITQDKLEHINDNLFLNFNPLKTLEKQREKEFEEMQECIEAGRQDFIQRMAEAGAEAQVKAMRTSPFLFDEIIGVLSNLCGNRHYNTTCDEDTMNDYVRDMLDDKIKAVRDQTRQGRSQNSKIAEKGKAGELDIQIRYNGRPIGIYEGLRLESVNESIIHEHIKKATINYNPQGVKEVFVIAYVIKQTARYGEFWNRFLLCVRKYKVEKSEYNIVWDDEETDTGLSAIRCIHGIYPLDGVNHNVYVITVKIQE